MVGPRCRPNKILLIAGAARFAASHRGALLNHRRHPVSGPRGRFANRGADAFDSPQRQPARSADCGLELRYQVHDILFR